MPTNKSIIDPSLLANYILQVADENNVDITMNHLHEYLYIIQLCYIRLTHNQLFTNEFHTSAVGPILDNIDIDPEFNPQVIKSVISNIPNDTDKEFVIESVDYLTRNYNSSTTMDSSDTHKLISNIIRNDYSPYKIKFSGDIPVVITHDDLINYVLADNPDKNKYLDNPYSNDNQDNNRTKHNVDSFLKMPTYSSEKSDKLVELL